MASITIREAQRAVDDWIKSVGVRYFSELTNLAQLVEEVGELARLISRTYGDQSFKDSEESRDLAEEMADVLFVLICLANQTNVDLDVALTKNLELKTHRDRDRHAANPKLKRPSKTLARSSSRPSKANAKSHAVAGKPRKKKLKTNRI